MRRNSSIAIGAILAGTSWACGGGLDDHYVESEAARRVTRDLASLRTIAEITGPLVDLGLASEDVMAPIADVYRSRMPCADVSLTAGVLDVDFPGGCARYGRVVSGAFALMVTRTSSASYLTLLMDEQTAQGGARDGSASLWGEDGALRVDVDLMVIEEAVTTEKRFAGVMTPDAAGVRITGMASRDDGATLEASTLRSVYVRFGDRCPRAGRVALERPGHPLTTVKFLARTPSTGEVLVGVGQRPARTVTLPECSGR